MRIHAAAVYCSDGRFGDQCDQFLHDRLGLPNYDRIALPGGPGALVGHEQAAIDRNALLDDLMFLVRAHELDRIVLIAHQACAFYATRLGLSGDALRQQQIDDLAAVAREMRDEAGLKHVLTYMARVENERVLFDPVETL